MTKVADYRLSKSANNDGTKSNVLDVPSSYRDIQKTLGAASLLKKLRKQQFEVLHTLEFKK